MSLSQIELVSVWVRLEWECFWVNLRKDNKVSESKMAVTESNMPEFKMAAIIKLSQNEWEKFFFVQNSWIQDDQIQDGCHHQVEWEWRSLSQIELVWVRVLFKMAESKMAEFKMAAIIKLIRLNEWSILCKWWRGKSKWSFFFGNGGNQSWQVWVSLRRKTNMAESKMAKLKMAAIIKLSQNE